LGAKVVWVEASEVNKAVLEFAEENKIRERMRL